MFHIQIFYAISVEVEKNVKNQTTGILFLEDVFVLVV